MGISTAETSLPRRPALAPGLVVARRDGQHLQVGVDPPGRVLLPDQPEVRHLLDDLAAGRALRADAPLARRALAGLLDAGLLVDADALARDLATARDRGAVAAAHARAGLDGASRLRRRAAARIGLRGPTSYAVAAGGLLTDSGVGVAGPTDRAELSVVLAEGVLLREELDDLVRDGIPHLVVQVEARSATVGPFVVPGATACLRCVDAHLAESDPRRPLVLEQAGRQAHRGTPPRDPALTTMAIAAAVHDVVSWLDGEAPASWSATLRLGAADGPELRRWPRHPHCGCAWAGAMAG